MTDLDHLTSDLPDAEGARRFFASLEEKHPRDANKLRKNEGLLSDVLTIAAYSPLLSTTLLQNPDYLWWLNRKRRSPAVRTKDELLEALGRFMLTHSQLDLHTQLARFRRRELMRIFLADIRRLATIAEITEDISNLADAILETALRAARQEMDNRSGPPQLLDDKGRKTTAEFCIVSLGKLGSHELNYSSDIDLLFLYSSEGTTAGGTRGPVTNREYFIKLGETVAGLVGKQVGEGAAYRIDMRLRPHGRVGPLAISVADAVRYYTGEARDWERQVLIRSRSSAGDAQVYRDFFEQVEETVYGSQSTEAALANVRRSKQLIDLEQKPDRGINVKLGRGGIREIEFIAQALQLAHGGDDRWLRASHTLISLSRLADRGLIYESELTQLYNAYDFLRRLEHVLQMENGLQTHTVPEDPSRRSLVSRRMRYETMSDLDRDLARHAEDVHRVFTRIFSPGPSSATALMSAESDSSAVRTRTAEEDSPPPDSIREPQVERSVLFTSEEYAASLQHAVLAEPDFRHRLGAFRLHWTRLRDEIVAADRERAIDIASSKRAQTALAEASIEVALEITRSELAARYRTKLDQLKLAVLALGKLGGGTVDYESDLDIVLVYDETKPIQVKITHGEFYSRVAETFVTALSSVTRHGSIYRVDLRLRPYGRNGTSAISATAFREYIREKAAVWEWLAYVKIRGVAGDTDLARGVETDVRDLIYQRAASIDSDDLAAETRRMRLLLEQERAGRTRGKEVDIKYGSGGMLDVYFAMRYLQLRDGIHDAEDDRSTANMLHTLLKTGSLSTENFRGLEEGYRFLAELDHELRLAAGRTTRLPLGNLAALEAVAQRMNLSTPDELVEQLTVHRLNIRSAFNSVTGCIGR